MTVLPPFAYLAATLLQAPQAIVTGTIRDQETGAPIAGAEVVLSDLSRVTTADAEGRYVFVEVPAGPQHLAVRYIGYAPRVMHALVPREGTLQITIALHPSPRRLRTIEVRPPVAVRGLDADTTSLPGRALSIAAIRNHPLLAEPDALEALAGGGVVLQPESPGGVHVYGGSADETAYALDGVPVLSPYHSAGLFTAWNPDALAGVSLSPTGAADDAASGLSGVISGATRSPGDRVRTQGALSTTQGRLTVDGPVGIGGAGFLASIRSGFPGGVGGGPDPSRIRGETGDELAKLVVPVAGGELRLLAYDNENELNAAAVAETEPASPMPPPPRNRFEWKGTSLGGEWRRETRSGAVRLSGWSATTGATASWLGATGPIAMASSRSDLGGLAAVERRGSRASTVLGVRFERSLTAYHVVPDSGSASWELLARTPTASVFARQTRALTRRVGLELGATATAGAGGIWLDPGVRLEYRPGTDVHLSASWIRRHQLSQSLRNPESLIGNVFPADFFVGSGAGVPVARSDLAVLALEVRPSAGLHFGASAYARRLERPRAGRDTLGRAVRHHGLRDGLGNGLWRLSRRLVRHRALRGRGRLRFPAPSPQRRPGELRTGIRHRTPAVGRGHRFSHGHLFRADRSRRGGGQARNPVVRRRRVGVLQPARQDLRARREPPVSECRARRHRPAAIPAARPWRPATLPPARGRTGCRHRRVRDDDQPARPQQRADLRAGSIHGSTGCRGDAPVLAPRRGSGLAVLNRSRVTRHKTPAAGLLLGHAPGDDVVPRPVHRGV